MGFFEGPCLGGKKVLTARVMKTGFALALGSVLPKLGLEIRLPDLDFFGRRDGTAREVDDTPKVFGVTDGLSAEDAWALQSLTGE